MTSRQRFFKIREIYSSEVKKHQEVAKLYCQIWEEPPWNEHFWTTERVISDIQKEKAKPWATMFIAETMNDGCIGFTWGYEVSPEDLREISGANALDKIFARGKKVFYIDELGVKPTVRNRGIGKKLSRALVERARDIGCTSIVLRTDVEAQAARAVYAKIGFKEMDVHDAQYEKRTYWLKKLKLRSNCFKCKNCSLFQQLEPQSQLTSQPWGPPHGMGGSGLRAGSGYDLLAYLRKEDARGWGH